MLIKAISPIKKPFSRITIILEETTLDEMTEDLSLTEIEQNLVQIILITKIFKEKHQEETIIMLQN